MKTHLAIVHHVGTIELVDVQLPRHVLDDAVDIPDELTFDAGNEAGSARGGAGIDGERPEHGRV